ncbi:MAG: DUF86 domain-containing protein [Flavipsychrobacter sp.]|nr:DUF86 domain-containing protein [Flavipsychrobacter sp.]
MSKKSTSIIIDDILSFIDRIQLYTDIVSFDDFTANAMMVEACLYNIQIIGEAVTDLDDNIKAANPQIPWILITNMRNRITHEYAGVDLPAIWNVIKQDLPYLKVQLTKLKNTLP